MMRFLHFVPVLLLASTLTPRAAHAQKRLSDSDLVDREEICGRVMEVNCVSSESVTLETPRGTWVTLRIRGDEGSAETRDTIARLRGRNVCVTGHLTEKANSFGAALFAVARTDDLTVQDGDPLSDWVPKDVARSCDTGLVWPRAKKTAHPSYPSAVMRAGGQGAVWIAAIIDTDGHVREARVDHAFDPVLDSSVELKEEAIKTVRKWEFEPARKDGVPVRALAIIELTFTLKNDRPPR